MTLLKEGVRFIFIAASIGAAVEKKTCWDFF